MREEEVGGREGIYQHWIVLTHQCTTSGRTFRKLAPQAVTWRLTCESPLRVSNATKLSPEALSDSWWYDAAKECHGEAADIKFSINWKKYMICTSLVINVIQTVNRKLQLPMKAGKELSFLCNYFVFFWIKFTMPPTLFSTMISYSTMFFKKIFPFLILCFFLLSYFYTSPLTVTK